MAVSQQPPKSSLDPVHGHLFQSSLLGLFAWHGVWNHGRVLCALGHITLQKALWWAVWVFQEGSQIKRKSSLYPDYTEHPCLQKSLDSLPSCGEVFTVQDIYLFLLWVTAPKSVLSARKGKLLPRALSWGIQPLIWVSKILDIQAQAGSGSLWSVWEMQSKSLFVLPINWSQRNFALKF